jgi:hypothetical protein
MKNYFRISKYLILLDWGGGRTRLYSWLRHYATRLKVESSILNEVIGFFS